MSDIWNPDFFHSSPVFQSIRSFAKNFSRSKNWPNLAELESLFVQQKLTIKPVPQGAAPQTFEEHYEPRIYLKGELQTRTENWHDFFNAMIWLQFPETKKALNQLHFHAAKKRPVGSNRSPLENAITLFDECGCVLVTDDASLFELVRQHHWHELFWQQRDFLSQHLECVVVGHAMHEKALKPYIGMTSHALLITSAELLKEVQQKNYRQLDLHISQLWLEGEVSRSRDLQAFPLLGMPGWHADNGQEDFYFNQDYFRERKNRRA